MKTIRLLLFIVLFALPALACGISRVEPEPTLAPTAEPTDVPTAVPTPEPTPEPTPVPAPQVALGAEYTSDFMGVTVEYPVSWVVEDFFLIFMASSEELLTAFLEDSDPPDNMDNDALTIIFSGGFDEFSGTDPQSILDEAIEEFGLLDENVQVTQGPTEMTVNGREAIYLVAEGEVDDGYPLAVLYTVIVDDVLERAVILIGVTSPAGMPNFLPTFMAIADSIEISDPSFGFDFDDSDMVFYGFPETGVVTADGPATFVFFGITGDVIDIVVDPVGGFDAVVDVLDAQGNSILPFGEVDQSFGREEIRGLFIEESGDYTIVVRGFAGDTGSFELLVTEAGDLLSLLTSPGIEIFISGEFAENEEIGYLFGADAGAFLTAIVTPFDDLDVVVSVVDFFSEEVLLEVDDFFGEETLAYEVEEDGIYLLVITGYLGAGGAYDLLVTTTPDVEFELVDGAMVTGWYDQTSRHQFVIVLDEGQELVVILEPDDFDAVAELLDVDENSLAQVDDGWSGEQEYLTYVSLADDIYLLVSRAFSSAIDGRYTMFVFILD